ncbi:glycyl-radical enzyme activating protein family [Archaeoglobus sulfaticallidus PM70-1]|uniref:Glycyl-radical enzyme activating protein family n=1 Tax=Archaeoglobus sulfaticallidus PM70-1 TaxID=387631 RepID=N0BFT2_9EURY|nr:glycyl-radical enzyme activating protein [Archaeoglobus sulfaticallidus]AGK61142.1 glycyl-radical enzyme activating protein family [Archaeoglobus sulfaticallidus PM70-1]
MKGRIFRIQRFSIHDGYGIRTTVFLKGCPLRCVWCHNPESQRFDIDLAYREDMCTGCLSCIEVCERDALLWEGERVSVNSDLCNGCGACVENCSNNALILYGYDIEAEDVIREVEKDLIFYRNSSGGVTFSGGEPYFQTDFLLELLRLCRERGISTAVDTSGYTRWENIEKSLNLVDLFLYDLKDYDSQRHLRFTGVDNRTILENLEKLVKTAEVVVRIPFIPSCNFQSERDFQGFLELLIKLDVERVDVLPYHSLSRDKYRWLDMEFYDVRDKLKPNHEDFADMIRNAGFKVSTGGYF